MVYFKKDLFIALLILMLSWVHHCSYHPHQPAHSGHSYRESE
jgi:hypothetical protein